MFDRVRNTPLRYLDYRQIWKAAHQTYRLLFFGTSSEKKKLPSGKKKYFPQISSQILALLIFRIKIKDSLNFVTALGDNFNSSEELKDTLNLFDKVQIKKL